MTTGIVWWLVSWFALSVGVCIAHMASSWTWGYRIAPGLMASIAAMCVAQRTAAVFGVALTAQQNPIGPYLPAMLVLTSAATALAVMVHRRHETGAQCEARNE